MKKLLMVFAGVMCAMMASALVTKTYKLTDTITAELDGFTLTIRGEGAMPDWESSMDRVWGDDIYSFRTIVVEEGITTIGNNSFCDCTELTEVRMPKVTIIKANAFSGCYKLSSITMPNVVTIGNAAFYSCILTSLELPNVETVGNDAFFGCGGITAVKMPKVTSIGEYAFKNCGNLSEVTMPNVKTVGSEAFCNCDLISPSLPNATKIGKDAFKNCCNIDTVVVSWPLLASGDRWGLGEAAKVRGPFSKDEIEGAIFPTTWMKGDKMIPKEDYRAGCECYGITPKEAPQIVGEGEIVVTKEAITAARATTIAVEGNEVKLGVSVKYSEDITAEPSKWEELEPVIITIPVKSKQGFILLNSREGRVTP